MSSDRPAYKRVLLKLSGEALMGNQGFGIDQNTVDDVASQVAEVHALGVQLALVIGGGNIFRGLSASAEGMDRSTADYMGMLATVINAMAFQDALERHGADMDRVTIAWCPGSYEMPLVAKKLAETGAYEAVICLGAVIRGATPHFDVVAGGSARGAAEVARDTGVPVIFGVLTTDTIEQALERAGTKAGNKGAEAAAAAVEMASLFQQI